ncbi:MAG: chorismate synthase [Sutterellaceae bacterium]|nr:chorismate synthase [Sutterellaceae bacterium]
MSSSSIGRMFVVTNFGESHGPAVGCVIDGCPPQMPLTEADIQKELDRRKPGTSRHVTQRKESDTVHILSGVYEGKTTGTPIALVIYNEDQRSKDYGAIAHQFRPAHADWGYWAKFGIRDPRGGGRSSARLTAPTVAAGAVAKKWLAENLGITVRACVTEIGNMPLVFDDWSHVNENPFFAPNNTQIEELENLLDATRKSGESLGARLRLEVLGVPAGLGNPVYQRLDANLAQALMGVNAVKGVEIGDGFAASRLTGTQNADAMTPEGFETNHAGGILGGISSGAAIVANVAIKPTPSVRLPLKSLDEEGNPVDVVTIGRHDPCVGLRAAPVLEAVAALTIMDAALVQRAQCGNFGLEYPA